MRIYSKLGAIRTVVTVFCGFSLACGCEEATPDQAGPDLSKSVRLEVERVFKANLALHPANTTTALGLGHPLRTIPTRSQWGLRNLFQPAISIQWQLDLMKNDPPVRIAIIDESFDVEAVGLKHAFDVDAGLNLLEPGQPLWTAHRNGFHHGNLVASIIANQPTGERSPIGVLGSSPVELIPIVAAGGDGPSWRTPRATPSMVLDGLRHALKVRADLINISAGMDVSHDELRQLASDPIWDDLEQAGIPVICAVGNEGRNIDAEPLFPASIDRSNVIAVMAIGPDGELAVRRVVGTDTYVSASNWGPDTVDLAAPGEVVEVQARADRPELVDGTSAATAFVTAVMATGMDPRILPLPGLAAHGLKTGLIQFPAAITPKD